jgi:hypothetical protein
MNQLRPEIDSVSIPERIRALPVDERGYPVPWFVEWIDGKPEFRVADGEKWMRAVRYRICWVCGQKLGSYLIFVLGPMCGITRTTTEPACHLDCARFAAQACPFLIRAHMIRRGQEELAAMGVTSSGNAIKRNPGVALLWTTRSFEVWRPAPGEMLISVGDPLEVEWWSAGRKATRAEVEESIRTGLPLLEAEAAKQEGAPEALARQVKDFMPLLPE